MAKARKNVLPGENDEGVKKIPPEDQVRLRPIMGIRPGIYLACLYGTVILLILFFVLLYPGISNPGSIVAVKSEPQGAAVLIDGVYMDAAPCEIFVPRGQHQFEFRLPGFLPKRSDRNIGGRFFASVFFPVKAEISEKLEAPDPASAFTAAAAEYAAWSFTGEPNAAYQVPQSLSEGAYRLGQAASDAAVRQSMEDTITAAARFAVTRAGLRDLIRAKALVDNNGLSASPLSILASAGDIIGYLEGNPDAALWLGALLNGDAQSDLTGSSWYMDAAERGGAGASNAEARTLPLFSGNGIQNTRAGGFIEAGLLNFHFIPGGLSLLGGNFPAGTSPADFYISETVISAAAWERFLEQQPRWRGENTEALVKEELVTEEYLMTGEFPGAPAEGVSGISWYAAHAFCRWLSASLPSRLASWEVRLPTEAEWEYAAKAGALDSGPANSGDFWEWCEDPYAPLSFLSVSPDAAASLDSPEKSLRGGSWINPAGSVTHETRSSLPPSFCSPFVSFRPVIAERSPR